MKIDSTVILPNKIPVNKVYKDENSDLVRMTIDRSLTMVNIEIKLDDNFSCIVYSFDKSKKHKILKRMLGKKFKITIEGG